MAVQTTRRWLALSAPPCAAALPSCPARIPHPTTRSLPSCPHHPRYCMPPPPTTTHTVATHHPFSRPPLRSWGKDSLRCALQGHPAWPAGLSPSRHFHSSPLPFSPPLCCPRHTHPSPHARHKAHDVDGVTVDAPHHTPATRRMTSVGVMTACTRGSSSESTTYTRCTCCPTSCAGSGWVGGWVEGGAWRCGPGGLRSF